MRVPTHLLRQKVSINRRVTTGAGNIDTPVAQNIPAKIETELKVSQQPTGTISQLIHIIYLRPTDIQLGDRITLPTNETLETRYLSRVFDASGTTPIMVKVVAW
jgi:hypothetical protein